MRISPPAGAPFPARSFQAADWAAEAAAARLLDLRLYAVTDPRQNERCGRSNAEAVLAAIEGGATIVQLREKDAPGGKMLEEARAVIAVARPRRVRAGPLSL